MKNIPGQPEYMNKPAHPPTDWMPLPVPPTK